MPGFKAQNVFTNLSGRTKVERLVSAEVWEKEILPCVRKALGPRLKKARGRIGNWVVEAAGDDEHIHHFFSLNWYPETFPPDLSSWFLSSCKDPEALKILLGISSQSELQAHCDRVLESLKDPKFRILIKDKSLLDIENLSGEEQLKGSLFMPAFIYCPELFTSLSLNSTYYGQFKSKAVLGPLEELLIRKARLNENGSVQNLNDVWISMHAGCAEALTQKGSRRGVVFVGPTGTSKSTHAYGLASARKENKMHSDDWLFFNAGTGQVLAAENSFYMRTPIVEFYPELAPVLLSQPLENVPFAPEDHDFLQRGDVEKILASLCKTPAARAMVSHSALWPDSKMAKTVQATDLFLIRRDYNDPVLFRSIGVDEMLRILTSPDNVWQYAGGQNGAFQQRSTEFYYNPYLCTVDIDSATGQAGELDRMRLHIWRQLGNIKGLKFFVMNARLPVVQMQERLREFLESDGSEVRL